MGHLYTMFSFLVRTATRPGHTTRLNNRPGQTTRLTQNRNHEIPKNPSSETRNQSGVKRPHTIKLTRDLASCEDGRRYYSWRSSFSLVRPWDRQGKVQLSS